MRKRGDRSEENASLLKHAVLARLHRLGLNVEGDEEGDGEEGAEQHGEVRRERDLCSGHSRVTRAPVRICAYM